MQTTNETVTYINGITFDSVYTITYSITFLETTLCISILLPSIGMLAQECTKYFSYTAICTYNESEAYSWLGANAYI
jgi:hypothetical protein